MAESGGRLILGIGVGARVDRRSKPAAVVGSGAGITPGEAVEVMKGLWTQDRFEYDGEFFKIPPVRCRPAPMRKPHPPLLLGGFNDLVLKRAAEWGDGWFPAYIGDALATGPENVREGRKKNGAICQRCTSRE